MFKIDKTRTGVNGGWERYESNPVLPMELGETFDAVVMIHDNKYRMYFGWRTSTSHRYVRKQGWYTLDTPCGLLSSKPVCGMAAGSKPPYCIIP